VTLSEKHDVALGKVDVPSAQRPVIMFNERIPSTQASQWWCFGYPAVSADVFALDVTHDMFTNRAHLSVIARPDLTDGPISKVLPPAMPYAAWMAISAAAKSINWASTPRGAGNSGGPVVRFQRPRDRDLLRRPHSRRRQCDLRRTH